MKIFINFFQPKARQRSIVSTTLMSLLVMFTIQGAIAQQNVRTYANFQGAYEYGLGLLGNPTLVGSVTNDANAANGDPKTASTVSVGIGALNIAGATQFLEFTTDGTHANKRTITAGTPVTIKFSLPKEVLGLLSAVSIGTFTNLNPVVRDWPIVTGGGHNAGFNSTSKTEYYAGASLLGLLNGAGEFEVTFTPTTNYNGVYLNLSSVLSLGLSANLYHAYIMEPAAGDVVCDSKIDVLSGIGTYIPGLNLASITGSVTNPWGPVDNTPPGFATLAFSVAGVNAYLYHRTIFNTPSTLGDTVSLLLRKPDQLLDLSLLKNSFSVQTFNGATPGTQVDGSNTLLNIALLPNQEDILVKFVPTTVFDRVELRFGGLVSVNLYNSLQLRSVERIIGGPALSATTSLGANNSLTVYEGVPFAVTATSTGNKISWFEGNSATALAGSPANSPYDLPVTSIATAGNYLYKVAVQKAGCTLLSQKVPVNITVLPLSLTTLPNGNLSSAYASGTPIASSAGRTLKYEIVGGALPNGITLNETTGILEGTPTQSGNFNFSVKITDITVPASPVDAGTHAFSLTIITNLAITGGAFPTAVKGTPYSQALPTGLGASGGVPPYVYEIVPPSSGGARVSAVLELPATFTLSPTGVLSGTPTATGNITFTAKATDAENNVTQANFTIVVDNPLPVTLTSFSTAKEGQTALLKWSTTAETNSDHFEIQRSQNGKSWGRIGTKKSNGESSSLQSYNFTDSEPLDGENLYRLKMIDRDGTFAYSRIESLTFEGLTASFHPNPVADKLVITAGDFSKVKNVQIYDASGKTVYKSSAAPIAEINVQNLSAGLYVVQVLRTNGTVITHKIIKQ